MIMIMIMMMMMMIKIMIKNVLNAQLKISVRLQAKNSPVWLSWPLDLAATVAFLDEYHNNNSLFI